MGIAQNKKVSSMDYPDSFNPGIQNHPLPEFDINQLKEMPEPVKKYLETEKDLAQKIENGVYQSIEFESIGHYRGPLKNGKPDGNGISKKKDVGYFLGHFDNGSFEKGKYIFNDGSSYQGTFKNNRASGMGIYKKDKTVYSGNFEENLFHGKGELRDGQRYKFVGIFQYGKKKQGFLAWFEGDKDDDKDLEDQQLSIGEYQYNGPFDEDQLFSGEGKLMNRHGKYCGNFVKGKKEGRGNFQFQNGMLYVGQYKNDQRNGVGILYNAQIDKIEGEPTWAQKKSFICYEGMFKNGLPHGKGKVYSSTKRKLVEKTWYKGVCTEVLGEDEILDSSYEDLATPTVKNLIKLFRHQHNDKKKERHIVGNR